MRGVEGIPARARAAGIADLWACEELRDVALGDARLTARLFAVAATLADHPEQSLPQAFGSWAATKVTYRFLSNRRVDAGKILGGHRKSTLRRMAGRDLVLCVQDTTTVAFTTRRKTRGLGRTGAPGLQGLFMHAAMAVSVEGVPLGLLGCRVWARGDTLEQHRNVDIRAKQSGRWLSMLVRSTAGIPASTTVLTVADRENSDALVIYKTNPHVDMYERGVEAARLLGRILAAHVRPVQALSKPPLLPPTINQRTGEGPMVALLERAAQWEARPGILRVGIAPSFPFNDFAEVGLGVVAIADGDAAQAQAAADDVAALAWELRAEFLKPLPEPEAAVAEALRRADRPVVLADVADNPGGGGTGDTTALLAACLGARMRDAMAWIHDPEAVERAFALGVGREGDFRLGGKVDPAFGEPVPVRAYVRGLSDGRFVLRGPQSTGMLQDIGRTAVLLVGGERPETSFAVVASEQRTAPNDAEIFRFVGLEPSRARVLLIKSRGHFRASFQPLAAGGIIEVSAPGAASPDLSRFPYRGVRRPIFPLDVL